MQGKVAAQAALGCLLAGMLTAGELIVTSDPPLAKVWVDGRKAGRAPVQVKSLLSGEHRIRLLVRGYIPFERAVRVEETETVTVRARLVPDEPSRFRFSLDLAATLRPGRTQGSDLWHDVWMKTEPPNPYYTWTYRIDAALQNTYRGGASRPAPTLSARLQLSDMFALELCAESFSRTLSDDATWTYTYIAEGSYPSARDPEDRRSGWSETTRLSGTAEGFAQRQRMLHAGLTWRAPVARRLNVELSAGPSLFRVEQDVLGAIHSVNAFHSCREIQGSRSNDSQAFACEIDSGVVRESSTRLGVHAGVALVLRADRRLGVVVGLRFATAGTANIPGTDTMRLADSLHGMLVGESYEPVVKRSTVRVKTTVIAPRIGLRYSF